MPAAAKRCLFAYYSGHADAQNLHLGDTEFPTEELSNLVRLSQAKLKVLLVDACRSGALTRVKGGRPVAPFQIGLQDMLRNEGYAIITSSSAGEDAQESEALRSSIFTHHFLAGLRGPADVSRDRLVTLGEAYNYASEQTLKTSLGTLAGSQHATFEYDLRGRADPVLTDLRSRGARSELVLDTPGEYLLLDGETGALLFEAQVKTPRTPPDARAGPLPRARAHPAPGVRKRGRARAGKQRALDVRRSCARCRWPRWCARARPPPAWPVGRRSAAVCMARWARASRPTTGVALSWAFELPRISIVPRLGLGRGRAPTTASNVVVAQPARDHGRAGRAVRLRSGAAGGGAA